MGPPQKKQQSGSCWTVLFLIFAALGMPSVCIFCFVLSKILELGLFLHVSTTLDPSSNLEKSASENCDQVLKILDVLLPQTNIQTLHIYPVLGEIGFLWYSPQRYASLHL